MKLTTTINSNTIRTFIILISLLFVTKLSKASKEDSLLNIYKTSKIDTIKFDIAARLYTLNIRSGKFDKAKSYIDSIFKLSAKINTDIYFSTALQLKGNYYYRTNVFDSSIIYNNRAIEIATKIKHLLVLIKCNVSLGNIYNQKADLSKSALYLQRAERYSVLAKDTLGMVTTMLNLGNLFYQINDYKKAKYQFIKVIGICKTSPEYKRELSNAYNNLANVFLNEMPLQIDSAMFYFTEYLQLSTELGNEGNIALARYNIAETYRLKGDVIKAKENYLIAEGLYRKEEDTVGLMKVYLGFGDNYVLENKNQEALKMLKEGLAYSLQYEMTSHTCDFLKSISQAYYNMGNFKESIDYYKRGSLLSDSVYNAENSKILYDIQTKYETTEKEKQNKLLEAENIISNKTIKQQQLISYVIIGGLILTLLLAFFIFRGLRIQRKANAIISAQKEEVTQQKHIVEEHQKEILDSIHYAKRIQNTLLAHKDFVDQHLPNNFVYFNPKDIVSGDFYWATKKDNYFFFAICDSTGHGVPGAFMSLLNIGFLSEAINEKNILEPAQVFNYTRERLVSSISKDGQKDGFDGILLRVNIEKNELAYVAANNKPVIISNNEIKVLAADKMPVGYGERIEEFNQYTIEYKKGDLLYLYTDGYADQFGGEKGKKFKYKQLNELLLAVSSKPLHEQSEILKTKFSQWQGRLEQVDDVAIIGIKL